LTHNSKLLRPPAAIQEKARSQKNIQGSNKKTPSLKEKNIYISDI